MNTKLVIFGITGDLSRRKLLPVLDDMAKRGSLSDVEVVGISRRQVDASELLMSSVGDDTLMSRVSILTMDLADSKNYKKLKDHLDLGGTTQILIYLAVPPGASAQIADLLGENGLNTANVRLLFEKPFGFDLESAKEFISRTGRYFNEQQIYRIDHYAVKDIAAALLDFKTEDDNLNQWSNKSVKSITIEATESIDIEDRAAFYEQTGALRDVLQGHLMQLLALVLMDTADDFKAENLPKYRLKALDTVSPANPKLATRGQYEGYDNDVSNPGSLVETFASVELQSADPRWDGVQIRLVTGKAMDKKCTRITVEYKDGRTDVFEEGGVLGANYPAAYEHVLLEAIKGDEYIFTTSDEIIRSWEILAPVQKAWSDSGTQPMVYPRGSSINDITV